MTSQTLSLNLIPKGVCPRLYVSQYDKGQEWNFDIYAGTEAYTIPSGSSVRIQGTKPDKTGFQYACSVSGNRVTATEQQQMTIIAGEVPAEIRIEKNNEIIATLNFIIAVEKAALADDTVISETELPLIEEAIEVLGHADELVNQIQGYATTAQNAASTATTKASQASTSATNASNSATTASNAATTATNKASEATSAASTATTKAGEASTSATSAAGSASTATTKAQEAAASAAAAAQSAAHLTIDSTMSITSENALQNKVVTSAIQNLSTEVTSVKETLTNQIYENGAKNLLPLVISKIKAINTAGTWSTSGGNDVYTINAVTFTITSNADGFITNIKVNGINPSGTTSDLIIIEKNTRDAFAMYDLVKGYSLVGATHAGANVHFILDGQLNNAWKTVQAFSGKQDISLDISTSNNVRICLRTPANSTVSNEDVKPILGFKSIMDSDDSFTPYALTNRQLTTDKVGMDLLSEVGAVNYAPNDGVTQPDSSSGLTFTVNADKSVTVTRTSGSYPYTVPATANFYMFKQKTNYVKSGTYITRGCPEGGSITTYRLEFYDHNNAKRAACYGDKGDIMTVDSSHSNTWQITVYQGYEMTGPLTFKPMITPVEYNGPYVPYAKSNRELTENVTNNTTDLAAIKNGVLASFYQLEDATINIYWTGDSAGDGASDYTTQQITDIVQAIYDFYKKLGGKAYTVYTGLIAYYDRKASDGAQLGSSSGFFTMYGSQSYSAMLADNTKARITFTFNLYGDAITRTFALWGKNAVREYHGINNAGTIINKTQRIQYNTISTYKG